MLTTHPHFTHSPQLCRRITVMALNRHCFTAISQIEIYNNAVAAYLCPLRYFLVQNPVSLFDALVGYHIFCLLLLAQEGLGSATSCFKPTPVSCTDKGVSAYPDSILVEEPYSGHQTKFIMSTLKESMIAHFSDAENEGF